MQACERRIPGRHADVDDEAADVELETVRGRRTVQDNEEKSRRGGGDGGENPRSAMDGSLGMTSITAWATDDAVAGDNRIAT
jgi:hypothetical protein